MTHLLARIGFAAMIVAGSIAGLAPVAQADDFGIEFRFGDQNDEFRTTRHHNWNNGNFGERRRGCRPERAVEMARYQGLRHVQISRITPRVVVVEGRGRYGRERMVFANVRGCPLIDG